MVDTVISDTEDALRAVAKLVEPCRVDKDTTNGIKFGHRVMWVFRDNPSVRDKHQKLQVCYQSLTIVFNCLYSKDVVVIAPIPEVRSEEQPPPYDPQLKELLEWQNRRKGRKSRGDKESIRGESLDGTNGNASTIHSDGTSSPCLLAVDLDDNGRTSSLSSYTDMLSESPVTPTSGAQPSVLSNSDSLLSPAAPSDSTTASPHSSAHNSIYGDEDQNTPPSVHARKRNDYFGPAHNLPKIDSPPFASMIAPYQFNDDDKDGLQAGRTDPAYVPIPASDKSPSSSAPALATRPSATTPAIPSLPYSAVATPTSSDLSARDALRSRWLDLSESNRCVTQESTEVGLYPPRGRKKSGDIEPATSYQSDRLDAIARVEDVMSRSDKAMNSGQQGGMKRGGRSWLAYHATRSDTGDGMMDWNG